MKRVLSIIVALLIGAAAVFFYFRFYFVFGEGVKSGELNYVVHKGFIFKTYEGKLIQAGFRAQSAGVQSYEFEFSVPDKKLAERLMLLGGQNVELHYKEYFGVLPWRGFTKFVVDSIVSSRPLYPQHNTPNTLPFKGQETNNTPEVEGESI
jgi:hypothetical protein